MAVPWAIAVRVVGPALTAEATLQPPQLGLVLFDLGAKRLQVGGLRTNHSDGRGTKFHANPTGSKRLVLFAVELTLIDQLDHKPVAPLVFTPNSPGILDRAGQAVSDDLVIREDDRLQIQARPLGVVGAPADTRLVTLGFNGVDLVIALETKPTTLAQKIVVDRPVGLDSDGLQADRV